MKFTIERTVLTKAIGNVARIVEKRNTIPILSNVALQAEGNRLTLRATDLDLEVKLSVAAEIEVAGDTTVPAILLDEISRKLQGDVVTLALDEKSQSVNVAAGRSKFKLHCLPIADFPDISTGKMETTFEMGTKEFKELIGQAKFAMSTEDTRFYLNGIFLHVVEDKGKMVLRAVATDGHRLALAQIDAPDGAVAMKGIIIPRKTVGELDRLMDLASTMKFEASDSKIRIWLDDLMLTSKLIDGTFPDYARVIPEYSNYPWATFDRKAFATAADRVSTVSSDRGRAVSLDFTNGLCRMVVSNPDSGQAEDEVPVDYTGDDMKVGFNSRYLQDILGNLTGADGRVTLIDPGSPAVFRGPDSDDSIFVLMPMRI